MAIIKGMTGSVWSGNEKIGDLGEWNIQTSEETTDPMAFGISSFPTRIPEIVIGNATMTLTRRSRRRFYRRAHKMWKAHKWTIEELIERQHALDHLRTRSRLS